MLDLIFISLAFIFSFLLLYLLYKIHKMRKEFNLIKARLVNIESTNKKLPKKQTGFGTGRAKDEHTTNDHDIYHY